MKKQERHITHPAIIKRLNRAAGHLASIVTMMENGRSCLELAQQLHAVESAISSAKRTLIHDHIDHCLNDAGQSNNARRSLDEFKQISKYL